MKTKLEKVHTDSIVPVSLVQLCFRFCAAQKQHTSRLGTCHGKQQLSYQINVKLTFFGKKIS